MSVQAAVWVVCDGCGEPVAADDALMYVDCSVSMARATARRVGWHYERRLGGLPPLDLCPECLARLEWRDSDRDDSGGTLGRTPKGGHIEIKSLTLLPQRSAETPGQQAEDHLTDIS